jgi:hypothetical protein
MASATDRRAKHPPTGIPVDSSGGATIDPTKNVLDLVDAAVQRQDDLRAKDRDIADLQHGHQEAIAKLRATHEATVGLLREQYQEKIAHAESGRLDSIRQVDREEVAKTAVAANTAIQTLAKQTTDLSTTLAKQVADTAAAAESRQSSQYSDTNKRLSALELSSSEGKGKQTVVDPQMDKLTSLVEVLARNQATGAGKASGFSASWAILIGAIGLIGALLSIAAVVVTVVLFLSRASAAANSPIYVPAPPGTVLPSTPPQNPPR